MANTDWNLSVERGFDAAGADPRACQGADLKSLLHTIVDRLADADRRHTGTLQQMQDRLAAMGREANTMRGRVPNAFAPAFERIEAGMAELADRIADQNRARVAAAVAEEGVFSNRFEAAVEPSPAPAAAAPMSNMPPVALRSAAAGPAAQRSRNASIDTFDVIETTMPGGASDPWDRDAADALAGMHEGGSSSGAPRGAAAAASGVDHAWLEQRFGEIAKRIEDSLADSRPDHAFFALGQRLESVEQNVARVAETAATHADVEGIRLIEAHIAELAGHLEDAQTQLVRLDAIEAHLGEISTRIAEVHQVALAVDAAPAAAPASAPAFDEDGMRSVARAAAQEVAQTFAKLTPAPQPSVGDDVRELVQRLMSENRAGEENTAALLDTLQQAMIRLLDRVDAMELTQQQAIEAQAQFATQAAQAVHDAQEAQFEYARENMRYAREQDQAPAPSHTDYAPARESAPAAFAAPSSALDAAVAAVASSKSAQWSIDPQEPETSPYSAAAAMAESVAPAATVEPAPAAAAPRSPERIRQDFIADARRAKLRLAAEEQSADVMIARPAAAEAPKQTAKAAVAAARAAPKSGTPAARVAAQPTSAPRLVVMGLAAATALGGMWYVLDGGAKAPSKPAVVQSDVLPGGESSVDRKEASTAADPAPADAAGASEATSEGDVAPPADGQDSGSLNLQQGTRGEIVPDDMIVGRTSVPLLGIAVDTEQPVTAAELERAQRRQTMAAMSTKLGHAAAQLSAGTATPASLVPEDPTLSVAGKAETGFQKNGMSSSSALDLPPATVGPLSLRLAAANGDPSAEFAVGARLAEAKGDAGNFKDAAKWYQRSADKGFAQAQYRLGTLYERGLGLKADPARAQVWYDKAASAGNIKAMHNLAVLSANQNGSSPDYASASRWFTEAAERGLSDSQFNLAVLFENGLGVGQDMKQAYKWLALAARSGDAEAIKRRDILKGKLTAAELTAADALVKTWRAKSADALTNDARTASEAWKKNPQNGVSG